MTDNEIIKSLECCVEGTSESCLSCVLRLTPYPACKTLVEKHTLDLIKRQKAEIERLEEDNEALNSAVSSALDIVNSNYQNGRLEAIKEFMDRLEKKIFPMSMFDNGNYGINAKAVKVAIESIKKEMVGDDK